MRAMLDIPSQYYVVLLWESKLEKSVRHVPMVAKFPDDKKSKIHLKSEFALFKLSRSCSISFNLSNVGEMFWC